MIEFRQVNRENFDEVIQMSVTKEQEEFLLNRCYYLALAYAKEEFLPQVIYYKEDVVGFFMLHHKQQKNVVILDCFLIRSSKQHQGYGGWAMKKIVQMLKEDPSCHQLMMVVTKNNLAFRNLLKKMSFREVASSNEHEVLYRYDFKG